MHSSCFTPRVLLSLGLCLATLTFAIPSQAACFIEFADPHPAPGNHFGATVVTLSNGNVVITAPGDDATATDAGAFYLFNGLTGVLIRTIRGKSANDQAGSGGANALPGGDFVVRSPLWDNGGVADAGAVTWGSGVSGPVGASGLVDATNSLVGTSSGDGVGGTALIVLTNGNYVVRTLSWDNGGAADAGAVTWASGTSGVIGAVSAANSLVGSTASDLVGVVTALTNGNYVVSTSSWDNGAVANVGAVTWGNGATGSSGTVSAANSLVGTTANDQIGGFGVTALTNGNYVVRSATWDNGAVVDAGAVTWRNGTSGAGAVVSAANSIVGTTVSDQVGSGTVTALANGNFAVVSPIWDSGGVINVGAVTWGNGTSGTNGAVSAANSLIGSTASDQVGNNGITALTNGNYVVRSTLWNSGATADVGAATWRSGTSGAGAAVSAANSLIGSAASDAVSLTSVTALTNGNYVVASGNWDNGAATNAGAVTWGSGTTGVSGVVSSANSLVGSTASDVVGTVTALTNGNYVVTSMNWDNGGVANVGAVTWGDGITGVSGPVSAANSLVGSTVNDVVGSGGTLALTNGHYAVCSPNWNNGANVDVGAVTWCNGTAGATGSVSAVASLVGSTPLDRVGTSATALTNGNYVVRSTNWDNGSGDVGAVTWRSGTMGVGAIVSVANSLIGNKAFDVAGFTLLELSDGNYVVAFSAWDNGLIPDAGAATWGSGTTGVSGVISAGNSVLGEAGGSLLLGVVDLGNGTFAARFPDEGAGRVRVGPIDFPSTITAGVDVPNDQGGWVRLTFSPSCLDAPVSVQPINYYGVWRHVPGTLIASAARSARVDGTFPSGTWELVTNVPAVQLAQYTVAVPTISNAAANDFMITAHTGIAVRWFSSNVVSVQSVDNLAPAQPTGATAAYSAGQTNLQWTANGEPDLNSYRVYRGSTAGFVPSAGNRIASPTSPSYADPGPAGSFYKLSAVDVNGNESGFALITPDATTGVDEPVAVAFGLEGIHPNPARGQGLHVSFSLPRGTPARLELVDVSGRRILGRDVGSLGAGRHRVNLAEGRRVAPGLYWVRLTQGSDRRQTRLTVIE
jgi:hypothetical protein